MHYRSKDLRTTAIPTSSLHNESIFTLISVDSDERIGKTLDLLQKCSSSETGDIDHLRKARDLLWQVIVF